MQTYGRDRIRFDQNEKKKNTYRTLVVAMKKKKPQDFLPFFQILSLFSKRFPDLENCWENFKNFSAIQVSVRTLYGCLYFGCDTTICASTRKPWIVIASKVTF